MTTDKKLADVYLAWFKQPLWSEITDYMDYVIAKYGLKPK
jgi:hypothetical protein